MNVLGGILGAFALVIFWFLAMTGSLFIAFWLGHQGFPAIPVLSFEQAFFVGGATFFLFEAIDLARKATSSGKE